LTRGSDSSQAQFGSFQRDSRAEAEGQVVTARWKARNNADTLVDSRLLKECGKGKENQQDASIGTRNLLFFVQIFAGNIVLRHLVRANFLLVSVVSAFDTSNDVGFECIPFLDQLVDALRIRSLETGQSL